jgi:hypothetical protein
MIGQFTKTALSGRFLFALSSTVLEHGMGRDRKPERYFCLRLAQGKNREVGSHKISVRKFMCDRFTERTLRQKNTNCLVFFCMMPDEAIMVFDTEDALSLVLFRHFVYSRKESACQNIQGPCMRTTEKNRQ